MELESEDEFEEGALEDGGGGTGPAAPSLALGAGAGLEADEVTNVSTASGSTRAGFLPVAAAAPVPAAPPARVPMAAPLPPPAPKIEEMKAKQQKRKPTKR